MEQDVLLEVVNTVGGKLRDKFGIEPSVNHDGSIIVEGAGSPASPIIPEEITKIIADVLQQKKMIFNFTDWPITVNSSNGNLIIRYHPT